MSADGDQGYNIVPLETGQGDPGPVPPPPHNLEVEQAFLGAILVNASMFPSVREIVSADDFYSPGHARIYTEILQMHDRNKSIDAVQLGPFFDSDEEIGQLGGRQYLARLAASAGMPSSKWWSEHSLRARWSPPNQ